MCARSSLSSWSAVQHVLDALQTENIAAVRARARVCACPCVCCVYLCSSSVQEAISIPDEQICTVCVQPDDHEMHFASS